ncbi:MAG TPA: hypothetical protein PK961_06040 [bacterium]|nr:hypothetical protein [bacterium]
MLKVYDRAPTFTAHTHDGGTFNLKQARQENTIVLVFLRGFS